MLTAIRAGEAKSKDVLKAVQRDSIATTEAVGDIDRPTTSEITQAVPELCQPGPLTDAQESKGPAPSGSKQGPNKTPQTIPQDETVNPNPTNIVTPPNVVPLVLPASAIFSAIEGGDKDIL